MGAKRRGYISITEAGKDYLKTAPERITLKELKELSKNQLAVAGSETSGMLGTDELSSFSKTPDEVMREAYEEVTGALIAEILDLLRESDPVFFEAVIVQLLLKMGYGYDKDSGNIVGRSGDDGVDGVINLDPLGVDQVYIQAKRYNAGSPIGSGAIRDFYGALGLKDVTKGIFVTTSTFSPSARATAEKLGARIVLIDGPQLAKLMVSHEVGCRVTETFRVAVLDQSFFE